MREPHFHLAMTSKERGVILQSLFDKKQALKKEGITTDFLDEIILKVGYAPKKNNKIAERGGSAYDAR